MAVTFGVFASVISIASFGQDVSGDAKGAEGFVTYTKIDSNDSNITFEQKLEQAFSYAYGLSTYVGNNEGVLAQLAQYSTADLGLIDQSVTSVEYTRGALSILQDACRHYRSTDDEALDIEFLARSHEESHQAELVDRRTFIAGLYAQLSEGGQDAIQETMSSSTFGTQSGVVGKIDYVGAALADPKEFKRGLPNSCANVDAMASELEIDSNNRIKVNVIEFTSEENK